MIGELMRKFAPLMIASLIATNLLVADLLFAQPPAVITSPAYVEVPPPRQEIITAAPSPQAVWVPGAWERTPDQWNWVNGAWVKPPLRQAYWLPGYWQHAGGQYQWEPGHWAAGAQGAVVAQKVAPPAPLVEVQPAAPAGMANPTWAPGHWEWRGTWVWVPGQYVVTANPQAVWVQGNWEASADGTFRWNPAHWAAK
jgi:hypothetical protein